MKPVHLLLAASLLVAVLSACRTPSAASIELADEPWPAFRFACEGDGTPALGTNQVMQIATELARSRRYKLDRYVCDFLLFEGWRTNAPRTYKWLVHFSKSPAVPDTDFFISVEDGTGRAELHHF
jgi:hypothetical protein